MAPRAFPEVWEPNSHIDELLPLLIGRTCCNLDGFLFYCFSTRWVHLKRFSAWLRYKPLVNCGFSDLTGQLRGEVEVRRGALCSHYWPRGPCTAASASPGCCDTGRAVGPSPTGSVSLSLTKITRSFVLTVRFEKH